MSTITVVGRLPDSIAHRVALPTNERRVLIHRNTIEHIRHERGPSSPLASLTLQSVAFAVTAPSYYGVRVEPEARISIVCVGTTPMDRAPVLAAIKLVPAARAASAADELWISTAYPILQPRYLRSLLRRGMLQKVGD